MVTIVSTRRATNSRTPTGYLPGPPPLTPMALFMAPNIAGNWLFAAVSWRQDAVTAGVIQYPSSVDVSDDAGNLWIPVQSGLPNTGVVRCAVWMAPAARPATTVFVSPTSTAAGSAYQTALTVLIVEVAAECPWYQVTATSSNFANQSNTMTVSLPVQGFGAGTGGNGGAAAAGQNASQVGGGGGGGSANNAGGNGSAGEIVILIPGLPDQVLTAGAGHWICPAGVTSVNVICYGGGGGGDDGAFSGGGGGGECASEPALAVTPGHSYAWLVGGGGLGATSVLAGGGAGGVTTFAGDSVTVTAHGGGGGSGGTGGTAGTGSGNTIHFNGGAGGGGTSTNGGGGGGGCGNTGGAGTAGGAGLPNGIGGNGGTGASEGWFTFGVAAYDNAAMVVNTNFLNVANMSVSPIDTFNGSDHTGDLNMYVATGTPAGTLPSMSLSRASGATAADFAGVMITVQGVSDTVPCPFNVANELESWPILITEIAAGPVVNPDPVLATGVTNWTTINSDVISAVTWPLWTPYPNYGTVLSGSIKLVPGGSQQYVQLIGNVFTPVSLTTRYGALAYVYSPTGFNYCAVGIGWNDSNNNFISNVFGTHVNVPAGAWTQLPFPVGVYPPSNAAYGFMAVLEDSGGANVPPSAVLYIGYAGWGPADSYQNTPADQIQWFDISSRGFTQESIQISRGIQFEQQSLEAGTMSLTLANNDGQMTFGNILSAFWPTIGDTDVPIRLRAIWVYSATPYYVLFSGFTDDIDYQWDTGTRFGYMTIDATDAWSRLTSQMVGAAEEEVELDNPVHQWVCNGSGTNQATGSITPLVTQPSLFGAGSTIASFNSSVISLAGDSGVSCWQSTGTPGNTLAQAGVALTWTAAQDMLLAGGITLDFWMSPQAATKAQPTDFLTVCAAWSDTGLLWTITIDNFSGVSTSNASINVYDKVSGARTTTSIGPITFLGNVTSTEAWYFAVTFTQSSLTVVVNPTGASTETVTVGCNLAAHLSALSFGGNVGPAWQGNQSGDPGFMNLAIYGVALYQGILPPARLGAHYQTAAAAFPGELDVQRLARIAGYAGATPIVLGTRGLDVTVAADEDLVTAVTDTNGQIASDYFTNIASSTLAFMFVNGPGTLMYRRRLEAYDRPFPQWAVGENVSLPLTNTISQSASLTGWAAANGATLTSSSQPAAGPLFNPFCGLFHGDGITSGGYIGSNGHPFLVPVTPGIWYTVTALVYSPQGWGGGIHLDIDYYDASFTGTGGTSSGTVIVPAKSLMFLQAPPQQAQATTAWAGIFLQITGTPPSTTQFYVADIQVIQVSQVTAGGVGAIATEVPYLIDVKLSSDRALLYNQAILTQAGTSTLTTFRGTSLNFTPSSGIIVSINNQASVNLRAGVPYQVSTYLFNTAQALPYQLNDPSIEDEGNWIVQTLSSPLMRPETVSITPAATTQATLMAVSAEVGDTVTFRRRPLGSPEIQIVSYISKLGHDIDIASGRWDTKYQLSPFPQGSVLVADDVIHGTLTGGNLFGW